MTRCKCFISLGNVGNFLANIGNYVTWDFFSARCSTPVMALQFVPSIFMENKYKTESQVEADLN